MSDRPIPFSAPMIRALLDGRKTQTRRIIKPQPLAEAVADGSFMRDANALISPRPIRWSVGDHLWVRESLKAYNLDMGAMLGLSEPLADVDMMRGDLCASYAADDEPCRNDFEFDFSWVWKRSTLPSIHMPRGFSRLTLIVSDVRVQRLQDISEEDVIAEGIDCAANDFGNGPAYCDYGSAHIEDTAEWFSSPIDSYRSLWTSLHGAISWAGNPWIAALTFTVNRVNIDALPALEKGQA
ncbi:MAG: hypothetical protein WDN46_17565 [Methylocella sp.]